MMDYATIRNGIVSGLYQHLQLPVVPTDTSQPKPPYPFVSYKFSTLYRPDASVLIRSPVENVEPEEPTEPVEPTEPEEPEEPEEPFFEYDIQYTLKEQPQMVLSISTYSLDEAEAHDKALEAQAWFKLIGYHDLKGMNLVVVGVTTLQDRSILIVDNFEKRIGFDVILRTSIETKARVETIEKLSIIKE